MPTHNSIAFLCHPYHRGGVTRWMADAAIAYAQKGHEVYFATVEPTTTFHSGQGRETMLQLLHEQDNQVHIACAKVGREFEFGTPEYLINIYQQVLITNVPVGTPIIISDDRNVWAAAAGLSNMYPVIAVLHSDNEAYYSLTGKHKNQLSAIACVSERVVKGVKSRYPQIAEEKIYNIPCGINLPAANTRKETRTQLQLTYVGRITEHPKRMGDLVKIGALLRQKNVPLYFNIIGDGDVVYKASIAQQFKDAGLEDSVAFRGWLSQNEIIPYLEQSDILLLCSEYEGMPVSMMEALASGCGFVGTRVSGIEDYEYHPSAKECFGVYEVGDIEDAVKKIQQIAAVPLQTRQQAARKLAESQFSMDTCLDKYSAAIAAIPQRSYSAVKVSISPVAVMKSKLVAMGRAFKMRGRK